MCNVIPQNQFELRPLRGVIQIDEPLWYDSGMAKLKLDLHDIFNKGKVIDTELQRIIDEAIQKKIKLVEIIPGKGSGALMKKVKRFLDQKHIRALYHRIEVDVKNHGRVFVHFRF